MKYIKKSLENRVPYYSKMITDGIILNANESAFDTPKEVIEILKKKLDTIDLKRYPDTDNLVIREAIAKSYNIDINNITCGVGSDQLLDCIFKSLIDDEYILACNPTFSMYKEYASYTNGKFIDIDFLDGFIYNTKAIKENIIKYNPKLIIICSHNNPTGSIMERNDLEEIIKLTKGVVLLDEAYSEFSKSNYDLAIKYDNVIVLKTFSKAYALAGIRLGYAISSFDLIDTINVVKPPYNLSTISQIAAGIAIENKDLYKDQIDEIVKLKDELYNDLLSLGLKPSKSYSNFIFLKFSDKVYENLLKNKIYIRKLMYNNEIWYRINTGTKEENSILISKIKEAL